MILVLYRLTVRNVLRHSSLDGPPFPAFPFFARSTATGSVVSANPSLGVCARGCCNKLLLRVATYRRAAVNALYGNGQTTQIRKIPATQYSVAEDIIFHSAVIFIPLY